MHVSSALFLTLTSRVALAQDTKITVTGARTGVNIQTGARPPRININDLYQKGGAPW